MAEPREPEEMTRSCPDCGHENPYSHRFCEECGGPLRSSDRAKMAESGAGGAAETEPASEEQEAAPARPTRRVAARQPGRRKAAPAAALDKHAARIEFSKVKAVAFRLRAIYALGIAVVIIGVLDVWAISRWTALYGFEVDWALILLIAGITLSVKTAGTLLVMRQPLVWGVVIAAEHTLTTALNWVWYLSTDFDIPPNAPSTIAGLLLFMKILPVLNLVFVPIYWAAVIQAARLQKLMAENPELQLKRRRLDPERHIEGGVADSVRTRRATTRREGASTALRIAAVAVPALALLIGLIWWLGRPEPVHSRIEQFTASWRRGDLDGIDRLFALPSDRDAVSLRVGLVRRGWDRRPPELKQEELEERGDTWVEASFSSSSGPVVAGWRFDEEANEWFLQNVRLPEIETEPLETFLRRLRTAWETAGTEALMALLEDGYRARRGERVQRLFERKGWGERRPGIRDTAVKPRSDGRAILDLETEEGDVNLSCEYWHPHWRLTGFRLPR